MGLRLILGGVKSYVPWISDFRGTGGSTSAAYCYSVWLRHLILAHRHGLPTTPSTVVELGPGDSIGVGLAAMLCGAERYRALDVVQHSNPIRNAAMLEELIGLFDRRADVPGDDAFPTLHPRLDDYAFPAQLLTESRLRAGLEPGRLETLREAVRRADDSSDLSAPIRYICPWTDASNVERDSADLVLSHVALEEIEGLPEVFQAMRGWLKPGGVMSHHIDFSSAEKTGEWNAHWVYSDLAWRLVRGNRPSYVNRAPLSTYLKLFREYGFDIVAVTPLRDATGVPRPRLARRFRDLDVADMTTSAAHILAVRR